MRRRHKNYTRQPPDAPNSAPSLWSGLLAALVFSCAPANPIAAAAASAASADAPSATTTALAHLGREIFFDRSLSASGKLACATCHDPRYAYGPAPGKGIALGGPHMNLSGTRAVPSLRYLHGAPPFTEDHHFLDGDIGPAGGYTWDGRAGSLREQARIPLLAGNEMANADEADVVRKLRRALYASEFRAVFGKGIFAQPARAFDAALQALEAFQQLPQEFYPFSSKYDAFLRGEIELNEQEERGVALFKDPAKGNCASCHLVLSRAGTPPLFTDFDFLNIGVPRNRRIPANADSSFFDLGLCGPDRHDLSGKPEYCGAFRAPSLRNVALRDAFFHNGVFHSLREVMQFYVDRDLHPEKFYPRNPDGSVHAYDDLPAGLVAKIDHDPPLDRPAGAAPALSDAEIADIISFLETLTDGYATPSAAGNIDWREPWREPQDSRAAAERSDEYAWRLFVAVNWPASGARRTPDAGLVRDAQTVWERWPSGNDVYRADGSDPGPWLPHFALGATARRFELGSLKERPNLRRVVAGRMAPATDPLAAADRLTEIHFNRAAYDYIRAHQLYDVEGQLRAASSTARVTFPLSAKTIKARWRPISEAERGRYHTLEIKGADGKVRLYGLTALHIASKDLPSWFWATFEHVDNAHRADMEGWQWPSRDTFACASVTPDCDRPPRGIGLEGRVWQNYRLRGTLTAFADGSGQPRFLANSDLESGMQHTSSCITCHARASIGVVAGTVSRLPIFDTNDARTVAAGGDEHRGFFGPPREEWFRAAGETGATVFQPLDFVWSMTKARPASR